MKKKLTGILIFSIIALAFSFSVLSWKSKNNNPVSKPEHTSAQATADTEQTGSAKAANPEQTGSAKAANPEQTDSAKAATADTGQTRSTPPADTGQTGTGAPGEPSAPPEADTAPESSSEPEIPFHPHAVKSTKPSKLIKMTQININGKTRKKVSSYNPKAEISFGMGKDYTASDGIVTFRGSNFRDNPVFGTAGYTKNKLKKKWSAQTGKLASRGKLWTGSGWTGQPLAVKWPKAAKKKMNMYSWAKKDDGLVEVIYACLDGRIYFLDMKTGKQTRGTLEIGNTFKGAGALDPRGYPILYVGAGYDSGTQKSKVYVISLISGKILYTFGDHDAFSMRGPLSYFDSSALVDAETDTLIYPGENGVLYLIKLGTKYNRKKGTLSVNPKKVVKWHYSGVRSSTSKYWLGMEDSAVIYKGYLYIQDNGGHFMCLDLNTMKLVWVQDCLDDSNGSPVMSVENGKAYLYASTSFHLGWRSSSTAAVPIWKIDAETGKIIWKTEYLCQSVKDLSGGVQSTAALGQNKLSDSIYVTVSRTGGLNQGVLACLSKKSGKIKWEHRAAYAWSSPVCVYDKKGNGNVIYATSAGIMYLLDGKKGTVLDTLNLGSCVEASPIVYDNTLVVGTRGCQIYGISLK